MVLSTIIVQRASWVIFMYKLDDGKLAIALVRSVLDEYYLNNKFDRTIFPKHFSRKSGVFVTLNRYPSGTLRGCIGYILPVMTLQKAIEENTLNAALKDPRFSPLRENELDGIVVEVSLLGVPEKMTFTTPQSLVEQIEIGRDGLIVESGFFKGLLLPQVPVDWGWDAREFLDHTCNKANLPADAWKRGNITLKKFSAQVFVERTPRGKVEQKKL